MPSNVYGARLKRLREARQMDQITLAKRAHVAQSCISDLEAGRTVDPGIHTFERLASGLGMTLGALLGITPEPKAARKPPAPAQPAPRDHSPAAQEAALAAALAAIAELPRVEEP